MGFPDGKERKKKERGSRLKESKDFALTTFGSLRATAKSGRQSPTRKDAQAGILGRGFLF
jgi:hypothetical protein